MRRFVPPVPTQTAFVRLLAGITIAVSLALTTIHAQIPGRNVNMVSGNVWPNGDPFLQRQNEPSIASSTRNPLHLLAGSNDYRTVDLPGLAEDETGDAWLGLFKSYDGGQRWTSTLLPGYPQDHSALGMASPIHGYGAGADPVVRAGTNGLIYYAGLAFDRSEPDKRDIPGKSAVFVARFIDNNNKEAGDTFEYLGTRAVQTSKGGLMGDFLDKPWMVVDIPRDNSRCTIVTAGEKGPITQSVPAGPVYIAYTVRSTDTVGPRYDIMFSRSVDCGASWAEPVRLNDANERTSQGATMAIDPRNGNVYIAWRQFDLDGSTTDGMVVTKYTPTGKRIDPPGFAHKFKKPNNGKGKGVNIHNFYLKGGVNAAIEAAQLSPLDQSTSVGMIRFRSNAYPTIVLDETGRIYMAWAERGYDPLSPDPVTGAARVLIATSTNGSSWTTPQAIASENQKGHQLMPSIAYSGGKLVLVYYDIRETRSQSYTQFIDDKSSFDHTTQDATGLRHTIDLRVSMGTPGAVPQFLPSVRVSDYMEGPRFQGGPNVPWQVNPPNLPMFSKGTAPFIGDYVDVTAAPNFVLDSTGKWVYNNIAGATPPVFHATWTDNRDVRVPLEDRNGDGNPWNDYTPPGMDGSLPSIFDPSLTVPQCIPGNAGSRNQNIYTARITGGLLAGSPGNTKRLGERLDDNGNGTGVLIERSFVVFAQNTTEEQKRFRFTIVNQPLNGRASWDQFSAAPLTVIEAEIPRRSTASRTVYATSTDPHASITITVAELELNAQGQYVVKTGGLSTNVVLNPDIDNPDIDNPDIDNPDIDNPDIDNAEIYNPDIDNPDIDNPDIDNPDIDNPDIDNPDIDNIQVANPDIDNPDIDNPDIDNPDIDNPDIDNPDIDNPDIDNTSLMTDVSWNITNTGNTTAAYNINLFFAQQTFDPEISTQLILYRTYKTPVVQNCVLKSETRNVLVANVPNPQLVTSSTGDVSNPNDPDPTNATIYLAPGESAKITLRVFDPSPDPNSVVTVTNEDGSTAKIINSFVPNEDVTPVVQQQSVDTESKEEGQTEPPIVVQFPPPQAVNESVSTAEQTPVTINVLANDSTAFGSTKIISLHPAGMATHSGGAPGELAYQPSTGLVYTSRGIIDPVTDTLVGRLMAPSNTGAAITQYPNAVTGINYQRFSSSTGIVLTALDTRPDSATFHTFLTMPVLSDSVFAVAVDAAHNRLYAAHSPQITLGNSPTTVSIIDINPASATFHQVIGTVSLPLGIRAQSAAVNTRTQKVYFATVNFGGSTNGGLYVIDAASPSPTFTRIAGATSTWAVAVNEANDQAFATFPAGPAPNFSLLVVDGPTNASTIVNTPFLFRFGNPEERLVVHYATGKVYARMANVVAVIDAQRGSPTRNQLLTGIPVGEDNGNADIAIDQDLGLIVTVGSQDFKADVIRVMDDTVLGEVPLNLSPSDVAIDPLHHKAFISVNPTTVQVLDLANESIGAAIPVFIESGGIVVNPVTNKAYSGTLTTTGNIGVFSGAGFDGYVPGLNPAARYLGGERYNTANLFFMTTVGDAAGPSGDFGSTNPGTVVVIDGATSMRRADLHLTTPPNTSGIGINQTTGKIYVGSTGASSIQGGLRIFSGTNLTLPGVDATFAGGLGTGAGNFPITATGAIVGVGRFIVPNPATGEVFVTMTGSTPVSFAVLDSGNALHPLDGKAGTPLFDEQDANGNGIMDPGESWGRVQLIRVNAALNRVYVGMQDLSGMVRIVSLDGTDYHVVNMMDGLSFSGRHSPSYLIVNEADGKLYVADYRDSAVGILNADTLAVENVVEITGGPSVLAYNATAHRLYVSSIDSKVLTALDSVSLQTLSTVHLPLVAYFIGVDEIESRLYTSGGDSMDESGVMVVTDILGKLGTDVTVSEHGNASHGSVTLNADYSITYLPEDGFSGVDHFNYTISAPNGTAIGTVTVNVVPTAPVAIAFGDAYNTPHGQPLNIAAPGPLVNDATGGSATTMFVDLTTTHGVLTPQANGSFLYQPDADFTGVDFFQYHAVTDSLGATNIVNVTISVTDPTTFIVTNKNDSGTGSLRQAMTNAQLEPHSTVTFDIAGTPPYVIQLQSALPTINTPITIDGYSQKPNVESRPNTGTVPGTDALIAIQLDGTSAGASANGLTINGGGTTIKGLAIGNFKGSGILLDVVGGNVIEGNFIGTDVTGTAARPNANAGIVVQSGGNMIGGNTAGARNLISGHFVSGNVTQPGIRLTARTLSGVVQSDGSGTVIKGNLIGTTASGLLALPNNNGIQVNVSNVIIGGNAANERNVIAGNSGNGISSGPISFDPDQITTFVNGSPVTTNGPAPAFAVTTPDHLQLVGNYIGVNAAGSAALANTTGGATLQGAYSLVTNNVISGNGNLGININSTIDSATSSVPFGNVLTEGHHTIVSGNIIGLNAAGTAAIANTGNAVSVAAADVTIGGPNASDRNVISGNTAAAISLNNSTVTPPAPGVIRKTTAGDRAIIRGNYIGLNAAGTAKIANTSAAMFVSTANVTIDNNYVVLGNANGINLNRQTSGATVINAGGFATVQNNVVGLLPDGTRTNGGSGGTLAINVNTSNNTITGNTVAGNGTFNVPPAANVLVTGISLFGTFATDNVVRGNFIGTNADGDAGLGNTNRGIAIQDATNNMIGGPLAADRNYIAGNGNQGVSFDGTGSGITTSGNTVQGNYIGVRNNGTAANGNTFAGVNMFANAGAFIANNTVTGNVIAGNSGDGISLGGGNTGGTHHNVITGNLVGVGANGSTSVPNTGHGVFINNATDNMIGGPSAADGNRIANNGSRGIVIQSLGVRNSILSNRIDNNGNLGIDLNFNGVDTNDNLDGDTGANNVQNYPVITNASNTQAQFDLSTFANGTYRIQVFASVTCDASGYGEGERFVGEDNLTQAGGTVSLNEVVPDGQFLTATATDVNGNTSEFSQCRSVGGIVVTNNADTGAGSLRQAITDANAGPGGETIRFAISGNTLITLASPLPTITKAVTIDGTTQSGYIDQPVVEVRGVSNTAWTGINISANNVKISGLAITKFQEAIFVLQTRTGIMIEKNFIGTNTAGAAGIANFSGINFRGSSSTIRNNVISGNTGTALTFSNGASNNTVELNKIGVAFDNSTPLANNGAGITLFDGSNNNLLQANNIANNGAWGIDIQQTGVLANVQNTSIQNNTINSNGLGGIGMNNAPGTSIGAVTGNAIQFNTGPGVKVMGTSSARIRKNVISDNAGLGIDLNNDGVTANDGATDTDSGPNGLQNFVTLSAADNAPGPTTTVTFDANVLNPGNQFIVDFYSSPSCDPSGNGEGRMWEGSTNVIGGAGNNVTFALNNLPAVGFFITATATDASGNTSEFSNCQQVVNSSLNHD